MTKKIVAIFSLLFFFIAPRSVYAASPSSVTTGGDPVYWGNDPTISYDPELGDCATLSNSEMIDGLETYLSQWSERSEVSMTFTADTGTLPDINGDNYTTYFYTGSGSQTDSDTLADAFNPVAFDDDGEITAAFVGESNAENVLGFAGPTAYDDTTGVIVDGQAVFNCQCVENHPTQSPCSFSLTETDVFSTAIHEFGHFLGLDHSQVNSDAFSNVDDSDNDIIPIMFPIAFSVDTIALTWDDVVSLANLYASSGFVSEMCSVTGEILDVDGNPLRCADVQARPSDPAFTVSFVSGALAPATDDNADGDTVDDGECSSGCGDFSLYLTPGIDYTLVITPIDSAFVGGSSLSPCVNETLDFTEEEIGEISGSDCTAGVVRDIGSFATAVTGSTSSSSDSGSSSGGSGGSGGSSSNSDNPIGYWCALNAATTRISLAQVCIQGLLFVMGMIVIGKVRLRGE